MMAKKGSGKKKHPVLEYLEAIGVALLVAGLLRFFLVEAFRIPSGSMIETLAIGDFIFVNKLSYRSEIPYSILGVRIPGGGTTLRDWGLPEHGDIAVFRYPADPSTDYIKRIVGLPGDTIELRQNELVVNGEKLPRAFVRTTTYKDRGCEEIAGRVFTEDNGEKKYQVILRDGTDPFENFGPITVKAGHVFAMGDNRDNSYDSRAWGQVPVGNIKGRALFVWLSVDGCGSWLERIRFGRFGKLVR
jgi:signal peptidase I